MHFKVRPDEIGSLARDFGLIAEAFADTFRGMVMPAHMDSRAAKAGNCDCAR